MLLTKLPVAVGLAGVAPQPMQSLIHPELILKKSTVIMLPSPSR